MNLELTSYSSLSVQLRGYNHCALRTAEGHLRSNSEDYCSEQQWTETRASFFWGGLEVQLNGVYELGAEGSTALL